MKHHILVLFTMALVAFAASDCAGTKSLTRRSQLADPIETGPITLLTTGGTKFIFSNYRLSDSSITGAGVRVDSSAETPYRGDIALAQIASIHAPDTKIMKFLIAATGIVAFGVIAGDQMRKNDFGVRDVVSFRGPSYPWSCPYLYAWTGRSYTFASETFAGAIIKPAERAAHDALAGCAETDGIYRLRLTNERPETHYTNLAALRAVDAPDTLDVIADRNGIVHTIAGRAAPLYARDMAGRDILARVARTDSLFWRSCCSDRRFARDEDFTDGIVLDFSKPENSTVMKLLVQGKNTELGGFAFEHLFALTGSRTLEWYKKAEEDSVEASRVVRFLNRAGMLHIFLQQDDGAWTECGMLDDAGPMIEKEQIAVIDCRKITSPIVRVKLLSTIDLWMIDAVGADFSADAMIDEHACPLLSARADDGQDVSSALRSDDTHYFTTVTGQSAELQFSAPPLPPSQAKRRHIIATTKGYYHQWFNDARDSHWETAERILDEPAFGARLLLPEWQKVRARAQDASARDADLDR